MPVFNCRARNNLIVLLNLNYVDLPKIISPEDLHLFQCWELKKTREKYFWSEIELFELICTGINIHLSNLDQHILGEILARKRQELGDKKVIKQFI